MLVIKIEANTNGSHNNHEYHDELLDGWALCPFDREEMQNFPFGTPTVEEIDGVMTVTAWEAGELPEPEPTPDPEPTLDERVTANEDNIAALENALCEMDAANSEAIASIENALCELDM